MSRPQEQQRRAALIASLRQRFAQAVAAGDAAMKQALFQEAAVLNLPPDLWQAESGDGSPPISRAPD